MAWIITQNGFISAVEYRPGKDRTKQLPEGLQPLPHTAPRKDRRKRERLTKDGFILARARVRDDLEQLRPYFEGLTILRDNGADYKWRAVVPRRAFATWAFEQAWNIDYDSHFKEVARDRSPEDPNRYSAMMSCWSALNRMGLPYTKPEFSAQRRKGGTVSSPAWNSGSSYFGGSPFGHGGSTPKRSESSFDWDDWHRQRQEEEASMFAVSEGRLTDTLAGMAQMLTEIAVETVVLDENTSDEAFDLWTESYEAVKGETDRPMSPQQVIDVLRSLEASASEHANQTRDLEEKSRSEREAKAYATTASDMEAKINKPGSGGK